MKTLITKENGSGVENWETCADDVFVRIGAKKCVHSGHEQADGCTTFDVVDVDDRYYLKGHRFPNGHVTFLSIPNKFATE